MYNFVYLLQNMKKYKYDKSIEYINKKLLLPTGNDKGKRNKE